MKRIAACAAALALGAPAALAAAGPTVTTLPRPAFPAPVGNVQPSGRLVLVSSRHHAPELTQRRSLAPEAPERCRGLPFQEAFSQGSRIFALYGQDGASARCLLAFGSRGRFRYGLDFANYVWPPRIAPGERELVYEQVVWAREADGVLYVENAHWTYARSSYGRNGYVTAIDPGTKRARWRSAALVANARTFVVADDYLVTGYGFTAEPDYLYLLDRRTGRAVDRLALPSAPERIVRRGSRIFVRTYDHDVVVRLKGV